MATLFQVFQFFDGNGDPLVGGKLSWYEAGTTTPKDTWIDQAETNPAPNPIVLDSEGRPPLGAIWVRGSYKLIFTDSDDVVIDTIDDINLYDARDWTGLTASIDDLNSTTTTALTKITDYTVDVADRNKTLLVDATSGNITINLLPAATALDTFRIFIKKIDTTSNNVVITPDPADLIDDQSAYRLQDYNDIVGLQSDGSNWFIIAYKKRLPVIGVSGNLIVTLDNEKDVLDVNAAGGTRTITLPAMNDVGRGFQITVKKTDTSSNRVIITPNGSETIDGATTLHINSTNIAYTLIADGLNWKIKSSYTIDQSLDLPLGYIHGYSFIQAPGSPTTEIEFIRGEARDRNNSTNLVRSAITKKLTGSSWAEGTGNGGRASAAGLTADTWYHCFIIGVPGTNTETAIKTDAGFDTNINATNLLSDAATFGYTKYRYVGSILTNASSRITDFFMLDIGSSREVVWKTLVNDATLSKAGGDPATGLIDVRVPPGVFSKTIINIGGNCEVDNAPIYLSFDDTSVQSPPAITIPTAHFIVDENNPRYAQLTVYANISKSIRYVVADGPNWSFNVSTSSYMVDLNF